VKRSVRGISLAYKSHTFSVRWLGTPQHYYFAAYKQRPKTR